MWKASFRPWSRSWCRKCWSQKATASGLWAGTWGRTAAATSGYWTCSKYSATGLASSMNHYTVHEVSIHRSAPFCTFHVQPNPAHQSVACLTPKESKWFNPLKPELNPICYLLALLGAHHFLHVSRIGVKLFTFGLLVSYIYIYIYIYIWSTHSWCF